MSDQTYYLYFSYRKRPLDDEHNYADPEYWDGQHVLPFVSDIPLDDSVELEDGLGAHLVALYRSWSDEYGYTAISPLKNPDTGQIWIETKQEGGESFYND